MFDSREYLASLEKPTFIASDGTRYVGRLLSVDEWQRYEPRMQRAGQNAMPWPELSRLMSDLTCAFFPRGYRVWTRVWWRPAWWYVKRLPPIGQMRAVWDFMRSQGAAVGTPMEVTHLGTRKMLGLEEAPSAGSPSAGS